MIKIISDILKNLCIADGVSGFEYNISNLILYYFQKLTDEAYIDKMGNVIGIKKSKKPHSKKIMIDAHYDEIGLIVTGVHDDGFLSVAPIGGVDKKLCLASEVTVYGKNPLFGVIATKPPHLTSAEEMKKPVEIKDFVVDIGYSGCKAKELVSVGDMVAFKSQVFDMMNGFVCGKALDDRAGVACIISALELLKGVDLDVDLYAVASVSEEVGCRGAKPAAFGIEADECITIDVTFAKTHDYKTWEAYNINKGPIIGYAPVIDRNLFNLFKKICENNGINYEVEVMDGTTGTNTAGVYNVRNGVKCMNVSLSQKYMHSQIEMVSVKDIADIAKLVSLYVKSEEATK